MFCPSPLWKVRVRFEVDAVPPPLSHCMESQQKWERSKITEKLRLITWGIVATGTDLTVIVNYITIRPNRNG